MNINHPDLRIEFNYGKCLWRGFIDINQPSGLAGYAVDITFYDFCSYWVMALDKNGFNHLYFFPDKKWFTDWYDSLPADQKPEIIRENVLNHGNEKE